MHEKEVYIKVPKAIANGMIICSFMYLTAIHIIVIYEICKCSVEE